MDKLADCKEKTLALTQPGRDQSASPLLPNRMSEPCACPSSPQLTLATLRQLSGKGTLHNRCCLHAMEAASSPPVVNRVERCEFPQQRKHDLIASGGKIKTKEVKRS